MDFDDIDWAALRGGYRVPYDPRKALLGLENGDPAAAWQELWAELYHQGDVGEASYAAVPYMVRIHETRRLADWNTYALVATIEEARLDRRNPELPAYLKPGYDAAWKRLVKIGIGHLADAEEAILVSSILGLIAFGKKQISLGQFVTGFTEDERKELLELYG